MRQHPQRWAQDKVHTKEKISAFFPSCGFTAFTENSRRYFDAEFFKALHETWNQPSGRKSAHNFSLTVDAFLPEHKNVLQGHGLTFHAGDLGNKSDFARAIGETVQLNN